MNCQLGSVAVLSASTGFVMTYSAQALATCPAPVSGTSNTTPISDGGVFCAIEINNLATLTTPSANSVSMSGTNSTLVNDGTITASGGRVVYVTQVVSSITNNKSISGSDGVYFSGDSTNHGSPSIYNYGNITASDTAVRVYGSQGAIPNLVNTGTMSGSTGFGLYAYQGQIGTVTNTGNITGGNRDIRMNAATFATLNNGQGAYTPSSGPSTTALTYEGNLPTNDNIIVRSATQYGQLAVTNPVGQTTFGIYSGTIAGISASTLSAGNYSSVLRGISASNLLGATTGTFGSFDWSLLLTFAMDGRWDLVVTAASGGGASSGSTSDSSTPIAPPPSNIVTGGTFNLASIGVTANPVFAGGVLALAAGNASSQPFTVTAAGGTIQSPANGVATLAGAITGAGALKMTGSGTTVLSGTNSYAGGTTVESGTLSVQGAAPTGMGEVTVNSGATLMGTGNINGNILVAGILKPGNSPGYLASTGNVTMTTGSTYQQDIAGTTQANSATPVGATGSYSYLNVVGGQFIINSGATLAPRVANLFASNESGYGSAPHQPDVSGLRPLSKRESTHASAIRVCGL